MIFANFRNDRARELSKAIGFEKFEEFERQRGYFEVVTMSEYDSSYPFKVIFKNEIPKNTLAEVINQN